MMIPCDGKWTWVGLLVGSAVAMNLHLPFIEWIGALVTGVYWFDVRPQLMAKLGQLVLDFLHDGGHLALGLGGCQHEDLGDSQHVRDVDGPGRYDAAR